MDKEKRADDRDKEKQKNHDKGKTIRKSRRGLLQGKGKVILTRQRYEEKKITRE